MRRLLLLLLPALLRAIKLEEFRTCADTRFCQRQRSLQRRSSGGAELRARVELSLGASYRDGVFTAALRSPATDGLLTLQVTTLRDATVRARIFEPQSEAEADPRCAQSDADNASLPAACARDGAGEGAGASPPDVDGDGEGAGDAELGDSEPRDGEPAAAEPAEEEPTLHQRPLYSRYDASAAIEDAPGLFARRGQADCRLDKHGQRGGKHAILLECDGYTVSILTEAFELSLETPGAGGEGGEASGTPAGAAEAAGEPPRLTLNGRGLLHYEPYEEAGSGWGVQNAARMRGLGIETAGLGEAEHHNGHTDLARRGPSSVGLDVSVGGETHMYGLPERAEGYNLQVTVDRETGAAVAEPYRLWNLDVFEYEAGHPMPLYGAVPFLLAVNQHGASGMLWLNPSETFVDLLGDASMPAPNVEQTTAQEDDRDEEEDEEDEGWPDEEEEKEEEEDQQGLDGGDDSPAPGGEEQTGQDEGAGDSNPLPSAAHFFSETGDIDVFLFGGPDHRWVMSQYAEVFGKPHLPPLFSLGYHQSRWNYKDDADVADVHSKFDEHDIPYDVLWLDLEHTDEKKYLTWDEAAFPDPAAMQRSLAETGRQMVVIVDPHLKADEGYHVFAQANRSDLLVRSADGSMPYIDKCWPGESGWLDYFNPAASRFWSEQFLLENFTGSTESLWIWNDMNEPSVFGGPEVTMDKSATHWPEGVGEGKPVFEHREVHNMYGFLMTQATYEGMLASRPGMRPFILSRAFFAGSQRHVAVWTGDSTASWDHLKLVTPMLLSLSLSGISFVGSDIGGFFENPEPELLIRWYETAIYTPFCRAHAHSDTARREPWVLEPAGMQLIRAAIKRRYVLLPYLYTLFAEAHRTASPVMRPLWYEFPEDSAAYTEQEGFMLGKALLVWPVTTPGATAVAVRLPAGLWFDVSELFWALPGNPLQSDGVASFEVPAPLGHSPLMLRAGVVVPLRERPRRATRAMVGDPVSLLIGVGNASKWGGSGELYSDDGESFRHRDNVEFLRTRYQLHHSPGGKAGPAAWTLSASTTSIAMMGGRATSAAAHRLQALQRKLKNQNADAAHASHWAVAPLIKATILGMEACPKRVKVVSVSDGAEELARAQASVRCESAADGEGPPRAVELRLSGLQAHGDWKVALSLG